MIFSRLHISFWLLIPVILVAGGGELFAQVTFTPDTDSRLWIEGRSNINQYICEAMRYDGRAEIKIKSETAVPDFSDVPDDKIELKVQISVQSFECGRSRMNRDLNEAMKSDRYPDITFVYKSSRIVATPSKSYEAYVLEVSGVLTIAGTSREIAFSTEGFYTEDGRMRARGKKTILMTDYHVEPPTGLFGLIKAENELTVHFDLFARPAAVSESFEAQR